MEPTPGKAFYQRQIAALEAHDLDALLAQYHADATMIGFDFAVKRHAAIRQNIPCSSCWLDASPPRWNTRYSFSTFSSENPERDFFSE